MKKNLKKIINKTKNSQGSALIEVLVAVTILTMILTPFLDTHLQATRNNQSAKKEILSINLAQEVMEEIKTLPNFLNDECDALDYEVYLDRDGYIAKYKIEKEESTLTIDPNSDFSDISGEDFKLEVVVDDDVGLTVNNFDYDLLNGLTPIHYYLEISEAVGTYSYTLRSDTINPIILSENMEIDLGDPDVFKFKITYLNDSEKLLNFHIDLDDNLTKTVSFYIIDDNNSAVTMINDGNLPFEKYYQISSQPKEYINILYKIEVLIEKDGEELNKINSYVKK